MTTQASTFAYFGNKVSSSTVATKSSNTAASKTSVATGFTTTSDVSQSSKITTGFSDALSKVTSKAQVQIREGYRIPFSVAASPASVPAGMFNVGYSESVEEIFSHLGSHV
jgi:hypothetical protein